MTTGSRPRPQAPRGILLVEGTDRADATRRLAATLAAIEEGRTPPGDAPVPGAGLRVAVDHDGPADLVTKLTRLLRALESGHPMALKLLRQQGVHVWQGATPRVAFLYTGQGSQYLNMLRGLAAREPVVKATFAEADDVMAGLIGVPLTSHLFTDEDDPATLAALNTQVEILQPGVLTVGVALTRLLAEHGVVPDLVMGHSLGEYGALVAAGALSFAAALEAVAIRYMPDSLRYAPDPGAMAAVFAPLARIQQLIDDEASSEVVVANVNAASQCVIAGPTADVDAMIEICYQAGVRASRIPVSHAFHTPIVAGISAPLRDVLRRHGVTAPVVPTVANLTGDFYPADADEERMVVMIGEHLASPVQFVRGLETLHAAGARVFVEVGPKNVLHSFVEEVLVKRHDGVLSLFTNHPRAADEVIFNQALAGLAAAGLGLEAEA